MNHQTPLNTRRPKTEQTTPKVTARPLLEEFSEAVLGFDEGVEEENDDDEELEVDDDDDCMSFASRTVYLEEKRFNLQKAGKMLRKAHTSRYPILQEFDQVLLTLVAYVSYSQDPFDSKRCWIVPILDR